MIMSEKQRKKNSHLIYVCIALLALLALPVSMTLAQERDERTEAYLDTVWTQLMAKVESGEMSMEDAEAKILALEESCAERAEIAAYFEQVRANLQAQVEAGTLDARDAETMMAAVKEKHAEQAKIKKYKTIEREVRAAIKAGEITEKEGREKLAAVRKRIFSKDRKDSSDVKWRRVAGALSDAGIERGKIRDVIGAMKRIMREIKAEGQEFELNPRLLNYLVNEMSLTDEQIEVVVNLSRRVLRAESRDDGMRQRIAAALSRGGIERRKIRKVMRVMRKITDEIKAEGQNYAMNPRLLNYLVNEVRLTDEQIEVVERLARRLSIN